MADSFPYINEGLEKSTVDVKEKAIKLVDQGATNAFRGNNRLSDRGRTPLHMAFYNGYMPVVDLLLGT